MPGYEYISSEDFYKVLKSKKEFDKPYPKEFLKEHQRFLANFVNPVSRYNSILVAHQPGLGKTLTSISIAENFKELFDVHVFTKNDVITANFKRELKNFYIKNETDEDKIKKNTADFSKRYSFDPYSKASEQRLSNKLIIIDEAHNITNNENYFVFLKALQKSYNYKLILLTATPMFDSVSEIFEIANLLNCSEDKKFLLPIRNDLVSEKLISKTDTSSEIVSNSVYFVTDKGISLLKDRLRGKVSFLESNSEFFPKKIFKGSKLQGGQLKVFKTGMSDLQKNIYRSVLNSDEKDILFKKTSDISTIVYPDSSYGKEGFLKYSKKASEVFDISKLPFYSPKLHFIVSDCLTGEGKRFIYSNYVNNGGTELVEAVLQTNGINNYSSRSKGIKYYSIKESTSVRRRKEILNIFNSKENINGELIKIIIGSPVLSEGVSFKNVRAVHILEPHWNLSRIDQVIGRSARLFSHSSLPVSKRNVNIYLHCSVDEKDNSIDLLKYRVSEKKDIAISKVILLLKEIAIDCSFNKVSIKRENFSRECNYTVCDYKCLDYEISEKTTIDSDTFELKKHFPEEYNRVLNGIKKIFSKGFTFDLKFIRDKIDSEYTLQVLEEIILKKIVVQNMNGEPCVIKEAKRFYYIDKIDSGDDTKDFIYKKIKKNEIRIPFKKEKIDKQETEIINISGEMRGAEFFIIQETPSSSDSRKNRPGRKCLTFTKPELKNFLSISGIRYTGESKEEICEILCKKLV